VSMAHSVGVLVEGEVGIVGGVEDEFSGGRSTFFNMDEALSFFTESGVDMLALGIGNAHGVYKKTENVDVSLLSAFQEHLDSKSILVLHGTTGLEDKQIKKAIKSGVVKINLSTELKIIYQGVIESLEGKTVHDEIYFYQELRKALRPKLKDIINKIG